VLVAQSVLALDIREPGTRARELLDAIAAKLGLETIDPAAGQTHFMVAVNMAWERAYEFAEQALDEQGDEGRMIVCVLTPS
jgi:hypothetical protein